MFTDDSFEKKGFDAETFENNHTIEVSKDDMYADFKIRKWIRAMEEKGFSYIIRKDQTPGLEAYDDSLPEFLVYEIDNIDDITNWVETDSSSYGEYNDEMKLYISTKNNEIYTSRYGETNRHASRSVIYFPAKGIGLPYGAETFGADYKRKYQKINVDDDLRKKVNILKELNERIQKAINDNSFTTMEREELRKANNNVSMCMDMVSGGYFDAETFEAEKLHPGLHRHKGKIKLRKGWTECQECDDLVKQDEINFAYLEGYGNATVCDACVEKYQGFQRMGDYIREKWTSWKDWGEKKDYSKKYVPVKKRHEWGESEIARLGYDGIIKSPYGAETFEARGGKRMYCPNCKTNRTWNSAFKKEKMESGENPYDFIFYVCQKCNYAHDPKKGKKMEDNWREMFGYDAETFGAELEDEPRAIMLYDIVWKTNKDLPEKVYISAFDEETLEGHRDEDIQDYLYERFNDYAHSYKMQHEGGNYTPDVFTDMKRFPEEYGAETFGAEIGYGGAKSYARSLDSKFDGANDEGYFPVDEDEFSEMVVDEIGEHTTLDAETFEARENKDGTIVLTNNEWDSCIHLYNGNYLWGDLELKLIDDGLKNSAKFKKETIHGYEALRMIHLYERLLRKRNVRSYPNPNKRYGAESHRDSKGIDTFAEPFEEIGISKPYARLGVIAAGITALAFGVNKLRK